MPQVAERTRAISVTKLHPDIGAEIRGVDLSRPLDEETVRQIKDAWHQHAVLLFRDQNLGEDDQRRFASHFGPVAKRVPPKPGAPGAADALVWDDMDHRAAELSLQIGRQVFVSRIHAGKLRVTAFGRNFDAVEERRAMRLPMVALVGVEPHFAVSKRAECLAVGVDA